VPQSPRHFPPSKEEQRAADEELNQAIRETLAEKQRESELVQAKLKAKLKPVTIPLASDTVTQITARRHGYRPRCPNSDVTLDRPFYEIVRALESLCDLLENTHSPSYLMTMTLKRPWYGIEVLQWSAESLDEAVTLSRLVQDRRIEALIVNSHKRNLLAEAKLGNDVYDPCKTCWIREWVFRLDHKQ
jgi:hypothetical protein